MACVKAEKKSLEKRHLILLSNVKPARIYIIIGHGSAYISKHAAMRYQFLLLSQYFYRLSLFLANIWGEKRCKQFKQLFFFDMKNFFPLYLYNVSMHMYYFVYKVKSGVMLGNKADQFRSEKWKCTYWWIYIQHIASYKEKIKCVEETKRKCWILLGATHKHTPISCPRSKLHLFELVVFFFSLALLCCTASSILFSFFHSVPPYWYRTNACVSKNSRNEIRCLCCLCWWWSSSYIMFCIYIIIIFDAAGLGYYYPVQILHTHTQTYSHIYYKINTLHTGIAYGTHEYRWMNEFSSVIWNHPICIAYSING